MSERLARVVQRNLFDLTETEETDAGAFGDLCRQFGVSPGNCWADRFGEAMSMWAKSVIRKPIRTLSLFSGAGGLDIGFHDAGFQIETAVEIDKRFAATLQVNAVEGGYLEGTEVLCQDVREFQPAESRKVDFILGGPPCQSFSAAGRRAAGVQGTQDARGTLFQEYVRLLKVLRPGGFLFENVYGITGAEQGKAWETIKQGFEEAGYNISFRILDAADYGVPQHRERMFIVGLLGASFHFPVPTHGPDSPDNAPHIGAAEAVNGAELCEKELCVRINGRFGHLLDQVPEGLNYSFFTERMGHPQPIFAWRSKFSDFLYKADQKVPVRTIKAQGGQYTGPFHWDNRPFSVTELKRLQTFPDKYDIMGSRQVAIHQIGNSVPPQLARILALAILQQVFGVDLPSRLPLLGQNEVLGFRKRKRERTSVYRSKATAAIGNRKPPRTKTVADSAYRARLKSEFGWDPCEDGPLRVQAKQGAEEWGVRVDVERERSWKARSAFEIIINSQDGWVLGGRIVRLVGGSLDEAVFIGVWKAFEAELVRAGVKADLVQLCEYYQYRPRFSCRMSLATEGNANWNIVRQVVEGIGSREILPSARIAWLWNCEEEDILGHMQWLRSLGYEARNTCTNPQIPQGCYLIPYTFPTLNPLSVQVRKSLVNNDE